MKHQQGLAMAAACGSAVSIAAAQQIMADVMPARLMGHVYINAATGERTESAATAARSSKPYWINADTDGSCGFFYAVDRPTRDTTTGLAKFGGAVVHWGDTVPGAEVGGYEVAYASNIGCDTTGAGLAGLDMINIFLQDYDGVVDPGGASASRVAALVIEDINGGVCTLGTSLFAGWVYTIDLEGTGDEFSFGGNDLDGDGLHDFGYSYSFVQGQADPKGLIGPLLVRPRAWAARAPRPEAPTASTGSISSPGLQASPTTSAASGSEAGPARSRRTRRPIWSSTGPTVGSRAASSSTPATGSSIFRITWSS